ncbi:hypothetical protein B0J17DRAFT_670961 [Rhizoctonia solani]|nr:hypothetical protein B0J17DRAFT_670961 [Rhizoctonia solani]
MLDVTAGLKDASIIVLFGPTGSGKTTFANIASDDSMAVGEGLRSCTKLVNSAKMFIVDHKPVIVIDSPGFDDTELSDADILKCLAGFLTTAYSENFRITGLLYMHKITDTRVGGASLQNMNTFKALCGTDSLKNVVYVTNMWSDPPTRNELKREEELQADFFRWPLSQGAQMARHTNTKESAHDIIRLLLPKKPTIPELSRQLMEEHLNLEETSAGKALCQGLQQEVRNLQEELKALREEYARTSESNGREWRQQLEDNERKAQAKHDGLLEEIQSLKQGHKNDEAAWAQRLSDHTAAMAASITDSMNQQTSQALGDQNRRHEDRIDNILKRHDEELEQARRSEQERSEKLVQAYEKALEEARTKPQAPEKKRGICVIA